MCQLCGVEWIGHWPVVLLGGQWWMGLLVIVFTWQRDPCWYSLQHWHCEIKNSAVSYHGRAANQYGTSVFCTDFTCKIREYEFGLQNTEIELCQFCHIKYCCQNKAYLFWVANQSRFVVFYALNPSNTSLITKTFILLSSTCGSNTCSSSLPVPVVPKESTRVSTGSQWVPPE